MIRIVFAPVIPIEWLTALIAVAVLITRSGG